MGRFKRKSAENKHEETYTRLGKVLIRTIEQENLQVSRNWPHFIGVSFVRGLFMGLGSVVGATILVAIAIWVLNTFDWLPVIGDWLDRLESSLRRDTPLN